MPCITEPLSPEAEERDRLYDLLEEIGDPALKKGAYSRYNTYTLELDELTRRVCGWAKAHSTRIKGMSLEFQIWWRDHQAWDTKRKAHEHAEKEKANLRKQALAKLTKAERVALDAD